jgi:hypothetical protein
MQSRFSSLEDHRPKEPLDSPVTGGAILILKLDVRSARGAGKVCPGVEARTLQMAAGQPAAQHYTASAYVPQNPSGHPGRCLALVHLFHRNSEKTQHMY